MSGSLVLLKHGARLQRCGGRAALQDVVIETGELLSYVLGRPPPGASVLHREQFGAEVVEPQHVGTGVVVSPAVPDTGQTNTCEPTGAGGPEPGNQSARACVCVCV